MKFIYLITAIAVPVVFSQTELFNNTSIPARLHPDNPFDVSVNIVQAVEIAEKG